MATRLEQLLAERAQNRAVLSESRREARVVRQQEARVARALARHWELSAHARRVVLIAYGLAPYDAEASVKYLAALGREKSWSPKSDEALARVVEDLFLAADEHEFAALVDLSAPADLPAIQEAVVLVEEWRVAVWARRRFLASGATVPTGSVLRRLEANRLLLPEEVRPPHRGTVDEQRARKWVRRWRDRWGGFYGKAPIREPLNTAEAFAKAADDTREPWRNSGASVDLTRVLRGATAHQIRV